MKRPATRSEEPLSKFALFVVGIELLASAAIVCYACTAPANAGRAATWFGERITDLGGPKAK